MSTNIEKTAYEWAKEYGVMILDPDGFGERKNGMPLTTDVMTESDFKKGIGRSTCKFLDMDLFRSKYEATEWDKYGKKEGQS